MHNVKPTFQRTCFRCTWRNRSVVTWPQPDITLTIPCRYYEACVDLSETLLAVCAVGLGLPQDYFLSCIRTDRGHTSFIRLNHYPRCDNPVNEAWGSDEPAPTEGHLGINKVFIAQLGSSSHMPFEQFCASTMTVRIATKPCQPILSYLLFICTKLYIVRLSRSHIQEYCHTHVDTHTLYTNTHAHTFLFAAHGCGLHHAVAAIPG